MYNKRNEFPLLYLTQWGNKRKKKIVKIYSAAEFKNVWSHASSPPHAFKSLYLINQGGESLYTIIRVYKYTDEYVYWFVELEYYNFSTLYSRNMTPYS
jgi:hypothetical protein